MLDISKIYTSTKCGDFRVISYISKSNVCIEFLDTGYRCTVHNQQIKIGSVKDRLSPSVLGVGFIGKGDHKSTNGKENTKAYKTWRSMLERCYCPNYQEKHYTYNGCSVAIEWHNFQCFAEWFGCNYINGFELDKDIRIDGNKIYSKDTCLFVRKAQNIIKANAKHFTFMSPKGEIVEIYNMNEFCRGTELRQRGMIAVNQGKQNHHKGWTKA
jgi:hypothetical protein